MGNLVYKRVSTDQQSTARQNLVLNEAGIEDPVVFAEAPGTSSRLHPLQRPEFRELLTYARPGDTVHISEMFRLVRGTGRILDVLDVLHRDQVALRIHDGASAMDLTARPPSTGELETPCPRRRTPALPPTRPTTRADLRRTAGRRGHRQQGRTPPRRGGRQTDAVHTAYLEGRSIAALARDHGVSRGSSVRPTRSPPSRPRCSDTPRGRRRMGQLLVFQSGAILPATRAVSVSASTELLVMPLVLRVLREATETQASFCAS